MKKLQNFAAGNPSITSTYAGEAAADYIAAALLSAKTLDNQLIQIRPNVKFKEVIQKLDVNGIVQDASCDFVTSGSAAITERILEPKELQVNLSLCKSEFIDSWEALSLGYSAFNEIPRNFTDYLVSYVGGKVAEATETAIWQGTATNGSFLGFDSLFNTSIASGSANDVLPALADGSGAVVSGSITSGNVLARLNDVYSTIPNAVFGKEDVVIYVPTNVMRAYQQALSGVVNVGSFQNNLNVGEKPMNFQGIELVHAPGMKASTLVAAEKSNLFFGTGLMSDYNEVRVLDMANIDGSQNFRIIMRYTAGTQFGIGQDIVYYAG
jgi:hypothetical protein